MSEAKAGGSHWRSNLLFAVMAFGQFMALLDIQIVASSINAIQSGLSAGPDEIAWVQTAYLTAEIVMIPLSGFLSQALSTRWLFALSAGLFTIASLACGLAWDMGSMTLFRAIQGFVGGAMIPTVFAAGFILFQGERQKLIPMILGLISTLAIALGPALGGWITEAYGWRFLFLINVVPGIFVTLGTVVLGKIDDAHPPMLRHIDWLHVAGLAVFLGFLQYALQEGPRRQWLADPGIALSAWLSLIGLLVTLERSLRSPNPVLPLGALKQPGFALACVLNTVIGFGLYAAGYLTPLYLGRLRGFSALDIGTTVFVPGVFMVIGAPLTTVLAKIDQRIVMSVGLVLYGAGLWMLSTAGADWGFDQLFWPQAVRGVAVLLCIVPVTAMALVGLSGPELSYGSGLFNLTRNLGGAIGIALVTTWLQDDAQLHLARLSEALGHAGGPMRDFAAAAAQRAFAVTGDAARAAAVGQSAAGALVMREAGALAFDDVFRRMAWMFLLAPLLAPFCRSPKIGEGAPVVGH